MKQNPCSVVGEVSKPTGIGLDELDGTIEALSAGVADSVVAVAQQSFLMAPEHLDDLLDWLQSAAHRVVRPSFEESLCRPPVAVAPELSEVLLDAPGPAGLEVELVQGPKGNSLSAAAIGILSQPRPLAARQWRCACLGQTAVFVLSHRIYRLTEVLGDVELVMHDVGLGHALPGRTHVRRPHVHCHSLDRHALRLCERLQQTHGRAELSLRYEVQHPRSVDVGQDAGVGVPCLRALLIYAKVGNLFLGAPQHAPIHCADHDGIDRAPGQSCERTYSLRGGTGLQQFDDKPRQQCGDPAVAFGPRYTQLLDCAIAVFELGHTRFDDGLELACVQVAPLALAPSIDMGSLGRVRGVRPDLALLQNDFNHHTLVRQRKVYRSDRPRRLQSKKMLIQRCVFHVQAGSFENSILQD